MNWQKPFPASTGAQTSLAFSSAEKDSLTEKERAMLRLFDQQDMLSLTDIHARDHQDTGALAITLLNLELLGHIVSLPGSMYKRCT
jgi:predicted transcriptional regulator